LRGERGGDTALLPDYPAYVRSHAGVEWAGCWAHARRKFFEAAAERPKTAQTILRLIAGLYRLERAMGRGARGRKTRAAEAGDVCPAAALAAQARARVAKKSAARLRSRKSLHVSARTLGPLTEHLRHHQTRLDNNLVENAIRPSAIGKKNWLFIGHPQAGQRSAIIYSIVVSCQRLGKDPLAYPRDVLTRLPAMTNQDDLAALTPARWQPPGRL
jgi:hypothetical protein